MRPVFALFLIILGSAPLAAAAGDDSQAVDRTRQTLLYGIDSQALEVVQRLSSTRDGRFTKELATVLAESRSIDVRKAILGIFEDQGLKDGEAAARQVLTDSEQQNADLLVASIRYLSAIGANRPSPAPGPARGFDVMPGWHPPRSGPQGKVGDASSAALLEKKLASPDFPDARKADVILALGDLKDAKAVDALIAIAKNTDEDKFHRIYAADCPGQDRGREGGARAQGHVRGKRRARAGVCRIRPRPFRARRVFPMLLQGLKDDDGRSGSSAQKRWLGKLSAGQADAALPALAYKARV